MFAFFLKVSPEAAQQGQALQMLQLFPCLLRLGLAADPPLCTRHQERQGLLLQHVRPGVHLSEFTETKFSKFKFAELNLIIIR